MASGSGKRTSERKYPVALAEIENSVSTSKQIPDATNRNDGTASGCLIDFLLYAGKLNGAYHPGSPADRGPCLSLPGRDHGSRLLAQSLDPRATKLVRER